VKHPVHEKSRTPLEWEVYRGKNRQRARGSQLPEYETRLGLLGYVWDWKKRGFEKTVFLGFWLVGSSERR